MAIKQCYAIKDVKGEFFATPFFVRDVADAIRQATMAAADGNSMLNRFAADYSLYLIGHFSDDTGMFSLPAEGVPTRVIGFDELLGMTKKEDRNAP